MLKNVFKKISYFAYFGTSRDSILGRGRLRFLEHAREQPVSFWRENVIAAVNQQRDLASMS